MDDSNMLKLNANKTEVMLVISKQTSIHIFDVSVKVGDSIMESKYCVRKLRPIFDSNMDIESQDFDELAIRYHIVQSIT